jgi:hypothetical protein
VTNVQNVINSYICPSTVNDKYTLFNRKNGITLLTKDEYENIATFIKGDKKKRHNKFQSYQA